MASLANKVAVVTGSSRGIGRAIAERFADDGASVVVNYNHSADEARAVVAGIKAKGGKAAAIQADCNVVAEIRRLFRETISNFGGVDIVVNNAGPSLFSSPLLESELSAEQLSVAGLPEEVFDYCMTGFARGPFFVMQEAARNLRDKGRIINISTAITSLLPPFTSVYAGAKAAMEAFSGVLASELVSRGITVNIVSPGAVETKMLRSLPNEHQDALLQRTPLGIGQPRDIAGIVWYLASDDARWITNEKIRCDGGIR